MLYNWSVSSVLERYQQHLNAIPIPNFAGLWHPVIESAVFQLFHVISQLVC
jgi:hypothetical protein